MLAGVYAARNLAGAHYDLWAVNSDGAYQEELRAAGPDRLVPTPLLPAEAERLSPEQIVAAAFAPFDAVALGVALGVVAGCALVLITVIAMLNGDRFVADRLSLLSHYLIGYRPTQLRLWIGAAEAALLGFALGYATAQLRNRALMAYAAWLRRRAQRIEGDRVLDEV